MSGSIQDSNMTSANSSLAVSRPISKAALAFWPHANSKVLWGWQRHVGNWLRTIYFSANLVLDNRNRLTVARHVLYYRQRVPHADAQILLKLLTQAGQAMRPVFGECQVNLSRHDRTLSTITCMAGSPTGEDHRLIGRLTRRRPRRRILPPPDFSTNTDFSAVIEVGELDCYIGSGMSYEAGIATLCDMHRSFAVDDTATGKFVVGAKDPLPDELRKRPQAKLKEFCSVHHRALIAPPTPAQKVLQRMKSEGRINTIFTDNVDNHLSKVNVPFTRVRGSGVLNERFQARFTANALLVVGVAADRREIVRQARARRMKVVVVNPVANVSPNVQHLEYLRPGDWQFRMTAREFFAGVQKLL